MICRRQLQDAVESRRCGPRIVDKHGHPTDQPAAQQCRCELGVDVVAVGDEGIEDVVVVAAVDRVAGEGTVDVSAAGPQRFQQIAAQPGPFVAAREVVFVDDDIGDLQRVQRRAQGGLWQAQQRPNSPWTIAARFDDVRGTTAAAPTAAREVQQKALDDVAFVVGDDDGVEVVLNSDCMQSAIAGLAKARLVRAGEIVAFKGDHPGSEPEGCGRGNDGNGFIRRSRTLAMIDDDNDNAQCRWPSRPACKSFEQRPRVITARNSKHDAAAPGVGGDVVKGVEEGLQGASGRGGDDTGLAVVHGITNTGRPYSASRAAIVSGEAAQYFSVAVEGVPSAVMQSQGSVPPPHSSTGV